MSYQDPDYALADLAVSSDVPFPHLKFRENTLLTSVAAAELADSFPDIVAPTRRLTGGDKTYVTNTVVVYFKETWHAAIDQMPTCWRRFLAYLVESGYREELARSFDIQGEIDLELRLTEYPVGGWMSRHTDRPEKLFSHNIYLCQGWLPEWGGGLALYDSASAGEPADVFMPGNGTSLAFVRSDSSWHEVMPVLENARRPRRAILVHGYRRGSTPDSGSGA
jgi:SM-20-related protein